MVVGDICRLKLESIAAGADAFGRFEGKPFFVEGGAPDETVVCRITENKDTWVRAELLEILEPSSVRVESKCAFYGMCGGCNLQHIDYNAQLKIKASILEESFLRIGGIKIPQPDITPNLNDENWSGWEYRNRMQFHCLRQRAKGETCGFGFKGRANKDIIAVSDCPVAVPPIRELLCRRGKGLLLPPEKDRFTVFAKDDVFLNEGGQQTGRIKLLGKEILLDAGLFFQSNCYMLEKLILELQKIAGAADRNLPMADLYCGVGTFAVFLAGMFPKIVLAEENKKAINLARENLKGINAGYFALRDTDWLKNQGLGISEKAFGFIIADPPRSGLSSGLASSLAENGPPLFAYVSCDAASLARDAKILTGGCYKLKELKLFDFYPQTAHIESLAVFER
ncbi:MAG: methyltransferase [Treponema sp.]|nr:methyltransferase [Treponema sp.]